jgi:hypothetical protein
MWRSDRVGIDEILEISGATQIENKSWNFCGSHYVRCVKIRVDVQSNIQRHCSKHYGTAIYMHICTRPFHPFPPFQ